MFEHLTADSVKYNEKVDRSKCDFVEDQSVHKYFRSTNSDYKGSGFDRGHLAAAGNHRKDQSHCQQTFLLSNMVNNLLYIYCITNFRAITMYRSFL